MEARERNILYYVSRSGGVPPFRKWRESITDKRTRAAIDARIARFRGGNFGDSDPIGEGASESAIDLGPGFRIYYGVDGNDVILIKGGDKSTQDSDIQTAVALWKDYKERRREESTKLQGRSSRRSQK